MKVFAIPTICGAINAAGSLIFFGLFAYFYSDDALARLVLVQAVMAMVQVTLIPQCWLYVLGGINADEVEERYWVAVVIEIICYVSATLILIFVLQLPLDFVKNFKLEAFLFFISLGLTGMSSHQGFFRARQSWFWLAAWMLMPTLLRLLLIGMDYFNLIEKLSGISVSAWYILLFFVVPDALRATFINMPWAISRASSVKFGRINSAFRSVSHNWLYDVGSGFCDQIDKVFVGLLVSPNIFVLYFFARRIGNGISIVMEPYLAEMYRRMISGNNLQGKKYMQRTLFSSNIIGATVAAVGILCILLVRDVEFFANYIPRSVSSDWVLFFLILLVDGCVAGSRWSRFVFQSGKASIGFLAVRILLKFVFAAGLFFTNIIGDITIAIMFAAIWLIEYFVIAARARKLDATARRLASLSTAT